MNNRMFCFQCEQTCGGSGCTVNGVCGKNPAVAKAQDLLTGALIGLARAVGSDETKVTEVTDDLVVSGLFTTVTNVNFDGAKIRALIDQVHAEKARIAFAADYDVNRLWNERADIRSLKSLILFGIRGMAAYASHAAVLGHRDPRVSAFFYKALRAVGSAGADAETLLPVVMEVGEVNLLCMALLVRANTTSYGDPQPANVTMTIEKGPFIVVTGHDLKDLELLLKQTEGQGVNVYTHGEMLPAHGYPALRKYAHLKGNFGTAWQNQQKEFDGVPGAFLFTTNCLMPPRESYRANVFTTGEVQFPGVTHIGAEKDFSSVIARAKALRGYAEDRVMKGVNGGTRVTTGFGRATVLSVAPQVVEAVKAGTIRHFFLVGGCDGFRPGRNYYTDFVKAAPKDTVILTLACGKYRFNDLDLGTVGGIPRLLDMGQCNDAYGAIQVALALAEAFGCSVNELPLSLVLSWYEQKAVCILLTLLHLGIRNIRLGPTLPAFVSPGVLEILGKTYGLRPTTTPEADLKAILGSGM